MVPICAAGVVYATGSLLTARHRGRWPIWSATAFALFFAMAWSAPDPFASDLDLMIFGLVRFGVSAAVGVAGWACLHLLDIIFTDWAPNSSD